MNKKVKIPDNKEYCVICDAYVNVENLPEGDICDKHFASKKE